MCKLIHFPEGPGAIDEEVPDENDDDGDGVGDDVPNVDHLHQESEDGHGYEKAPRAHHEELG
jgi:hypothetical protein